MKKPLVAIIMGSDSDLPVMKVAAEILKEFDISYELTIVSAHRTPDRMYDFAKKAHDKGIKIIIAGAGGAAHLPGMVAALSALPVIGVPLQSKTMKGLDSLCSIAQMPPGVPVASMAINGAKNAGLLAAQILGIYDEKIYKKVQSYKESLNKEVIDKSVELEEHGYEYYLNKTNT